MKLQRNLFLAAALLPVYFGTHLQAQVADPSKPDDKAAAPDPSQMMATIMELAKPGENHKILEATVGTWNYKVKWWMNPQAPPMESSGTCVTKAVMDGRYFVSDTVGKMSMPGPDGKPADMEFRGMGTEGFDNAKKKYVASWIDNMGTGIMLMEGTYDPGAKAITYLGDEEPAPGLKMKVRQVVKTIDQNHRTIEFYETFGGNEAKTMEITYTRS